MRRSFVLVTTLAFLALPAVAGAVSWIPIVPCGGANQASCTPCDLFAAFHNILDLILQGITGPIAAFLIVWAGGMMLLGGANPKLYSQGKQMLTNTLIGVAIILLAWLVTNFLIKSLVTGSSADSWYQFSCPEGLSVIKPIETALPTGGPEPQLPAPTQLVAKNLGVNVPGSQIDVCGKDVKCNTPKPCNPANLAANLSNAAVLKAIMINESSCNYNPAPSGAGAYGLMQLKPETAAMFREQCDLYEKDENGDDKEPKVPLVLDAGWLQSELNAEDILCVANAYVDTLKGACGTSAAGIAGGYNGGIGACEPSVDCPNTPSCTGGQMARWECPWDDLAHLVPNKGFNETRIYAPKVSACAK